MKRKFISKTINYIHPEKTYLLDVSVRIDALVANYIPTKDVVDVCKKCLNTTLKVTISLFLYSLAIIYALLKGMLCCNSIEL